MKLGVFLVMLGSLGFLGDFVPYMLYDRPLSWGVVGIYFSVWGVVRLVRRVRRQVKREEG